MKMNTKLLNKAILFSALHYAENIDTRAYNYNEIVKLRSKISGFLLFHKLSPSEAKQLIDLGKHEYMEKLKEIQIDFSIYVMALMEEWINIIPKKDRKYALNMSDKKILQTKSKMIMEMIDFKQRKPEEHKEVKQVITDSQIAARKYVSYLGENLK